MPFLVMEYVLPYIVILCLTCRLFCFRKVLLSHYFFFFFYLILTRGHFFIAFRERRRGEERERELSMWERNVDQLLLVSSRTGDRTHNWGVCPYWKSIPQSFGVWDDAPTNWATLARAESLFLKYYILSMSKAHVS